MEKRLLKPCPFCGGRAEFCADEDGVFSIGCLNCEAAISPKKENEGCIERIILQWNSRVTDATSSTDVVAKRLPSGCRAVAKRVPVGCQVVAKDTSRCILTLLLKDNSEFPISQEDIDGWAEAFPSVDILKELHKMKSWCKDNPTKRKTKSGIRRFVNNWLSREQDKPREQKAPTFESVLAEMMEDGYK